MHQGRFLKYANSRDIFYHENRVNLRLSRIAHVDGKSWAIDIFPHCFKRAELQKL